MPDPAPTTEPVETPSVETTETPAEPKQAIGDAIKEIVDKVEPPAVEKRKYKVKIDKEEREVDEDELVRNYQLRQASDKRFKEASEKEKFVEAILEMAKKDPRKALSHPAIGHNPRKLAEEWLAAELEEELMDPKEKELRSLRAQKEEIESKLKEKEEAERAQQEAALVSKYEAEYAADIETTVKASGLPYNAGIVNRVRDYMLLALNNGQENVKAADVLPMVKKDFEGDIKALFSSSPVEAIAELLGEDTLKKVRGWDISRLKNPKSAKPGEQAPADSTRKETPKKRVKTTDDYFEELRKKFSDSRS